MPTPQGFTRVPVFIGADVKTASGSTRRDYIRKKYKYTLNYDYLTQTEVSSILGLYAQNNVLIFVVDEGLLQVTSCDVLMDMSNRQYLIPGSQFRENITITLTEV